MTHPEKKSRPMTVQEMALSLDEHARWDGDAVRMRALWRDGDGLNIVVFPSGVAHDFAEDRSLAPGEFKGLIEKVAGGWRETTQREVKRRKSFEDVRPSRFNVTTSVREELKRFRYGLPRVAYRFLEGRGLSSALMASEVGFVQALPGGLPSGHEYEEWWLQKVLSWGGPALIVPQRDAQGVPRSFTLRFVDPPPGCPKTLYPKKTIAPACDDSGMPFVYGWPHGLGKKSQATMCIVGEGWAFPFECRQLCGRRGGSQARSALWEVETFAVRDAGSFKKCVPYVKGYRGRVVVVPDREGVGMRAAADFVLRAQDAGVNASLFRWERFLELEKLPVGFDEDRDAGGGVKDLGEVIERRKLSDLGLVGHRFLEVARGRG